MPRKVLEEIRDFLDVQEKTRERILDISRRSIRKSSRAMAALHRRDEDEVEEAVNDIRKDIESLNEILESEPRFSDHGALLAAYREFLEVIITQSLIGGEELLGPKETNTSYKAYVQALAESIGELRRYMLDLLRDDKVEEARKIYDRMEDVFDLLMELDYPDSILPGVRRRRDSARRVLEKAQGDITKAIRENRLKEALDKAEFKLGKG